MTNLLQINSSLFSAGGQSSQLADRFVAKWRARNSDSTVTIRDLAANPIPHLDAARFSAFVTAPEQRSPQQQAAIAESDALIAELKAADVIVLGLPLYNFGVPSTLKAYFDHVARAGVTFRYTDKGPVGLLAGKKVFVFATRGGLYAGTARDTQSAYVRDFLNFVGLDDVEFVYAEGLAMGDTAKESAVAQAHRAIDRLGVPALAKAA